MSDEIPTSDLVDPLRNFPNRDDLDAAADRLERLQAQVDAVRELHRPERSGGYRYCAECESGEAAAPWPCATIRALNGDNDAA